MHIRKIGKLKQNVGTIIKTVVAVSIFDFRRLRIRNIFFQIVQTMVKIDFEAEGDSHMVQ